MRDQNNGPFKIETLPMPPALIHENTRMPASYANFYIANKAVLTSRDPLLVSYMDPARVQEVSNG
jgi:agmatine/peptidylarginine deiminase